MLEERNEFVNSADNSFICLKTKFQDILRKLGWSPLSISGYIKEGNLNEKSCELPQPSDKVQSDLQKKEDKGLSMPTVNRADEGTSSDSEKRYNELLASFSFQPKVKREKLSDTQLLASLLEAERNAKRRRASYRNKVHTKNKSHTEVLREVIREQMEVLQGGDNEDNINVNEAKVKGEEDDEMIEISAIDGNPHLAWQTVGLIVSAQMKDKQSDNSRYRHQHSDRDLLGDKRPILDQRKYTHHSRNNSTLTPDKFIPKYHRSSYSRSYRHSSKDRTSKTSKYSQERSSKYKTSIKVRHSKRDSSPKVRHSKSDRSSEERYSKKVRHSRSDRSSQEQYSRTPLKERHSKSERSSQEKYSKTTQKERHSKNDLLSSQKTR